MPRGNELTSSGLSPLAAQNICGSNGPVLTATGTNLATALVLPYAVNYFTTVSASTGCTFQTSELPGTSIVVTNGNTGQTLTLYTPTGETINNAATSFSIAANKTVLFFKVSGTVWQSILTA